MRSQLVLALRLFVCGKDFPHLCLQVRSCCDQSGAPVWWEECDFVCLFVSAWLRNKQTVPLLKRSEVFPCWKMKSESVSLMDHFSVWIPKSVLMILTVCLLLVNRSCVHNCSVFITDPNDPSSSDISSTQLNSRCKRRIQHLKDHFVYFYCEIPQKLDFLKIKWNIFT